MKITLLESLNIGKLELESTEESLYITLYLNRAFIEFASKQYKGLIAINLLGQPISLIWGTATEDNTSRYKRTQYDIEDLAPALYSLEKHIQAFNALDYLLY